MKREIAAKPGGRSRAGRVGDRSGRPSASARRGTAPRCPRRRRRWRGRPGTIVVVTDLQESGWDAGDRASIPESAKIEVLDVGEPPPNLAVVVGARLARSPGRHRPKRGAAGARRARASDHRRPAGGRRHRQRSAPNQSADAVFAGPPRGTRGGGGGRRSGRPAGGQRPLRRAATARRRPPFCSSPAAATPAATRSTSSRRSARAAPAGNGYQVASISAATLSSTDADVLAPHPAVLLLSTRGLERRGREALAVVRAQRRRPADRRRTGGRRRRRRRRARARDRRCASSSTPRRQAVHRACSRRPTRGIRSFSASRRRRRRSGW